MNSGEQVFKPLLQYLVRKDFDICANRYGEES